MTTVYVAVLEIRYEPSWLCGVYSTKEKALEARAKVGEDSIGVVTIFEVQVDEPPHQSWERHKELGR